VLAIFANTGKGLNVVVVVANKMIFYFFINDQNGL